MAKLVKSIYSGNTVTALGETTATDTLDGTLAPTITTLTDAATITPDFSVSCNFTVTLAGNRTMANPVNVTPGQSGCIFIIQDATGSRTASWGSNWDWAAAAIPTLSTSANAIDRIDYIVRTNGSIHAVFTGNYS